MARKISDYQIFNLDGILCQIVYFKIGMKELERYANLKEKSNRREFHSDDIYIINKYTKGFKNKIGDYLDPELFENNLISSNREFIEEFFKQYAVLPDRIIRKDSKARIDGCGIDYYPVLIPLDKWAPGYEEYWDGEYSTPDFL